MYVTTFYSFKGGVGRTMALVNTAVELANTGRRVLAVDFDLEAPGLDTFEFVDAETRGPGIIDFVSEYLDVGQAPDVNRFISKSSVVGDSGGGLWIMPSGAQQETYAKKYGQIDWGTLYSEHDGYLLFEDLKEQWRKVLEPDFVLIDSRTGHTDTGGICTRQLPDAVAIFFFPNEQNLRGLKKVVRDIRSEADGPRKKEIYLHFVMSNVPDLDDEDSILQNKIDAFRAQLHFTREPSVIHRYDSLSLLNQVVFTKDRPKSRLAKEYRDVVQEIVSHNLADREGALDYVRRVTRHWRQGVEHESPDKIDRRVEDIGGQHANDGEVLFSIGELQERHGRREEAAHLFDRAIEAGYDNPEVFLKRARLRAASDDAGGASSDALRFLQYDDIPAPLVIEAVMLASPRSAEDTANSPAVAALDPVERIWLAGRFRESVAAQAMAESILRPLVDDGELPEGERALAVHELVLTHIGMGKFGDALGLLERDGRAIGDMNVVDAFNYGMATWGKTGSIDPVAFSRVVELDRSHPQRDDVNYLQCMAVAYGVVGDTQAAMDFIRQAREALDVKRGSTLSCWRYREVVASTFAEDLDEIRRFIDGDSTRIPPFISSAAEGRR